MKFYMIVAASISFLSLFPSFQKEEIKYQTISENYDLLFKQPRLQLSKETYKNLKAWKPKAKEQNKDTQYPATEPNAAHLQNQITKKKTKLNELTKNSDDLQKQCDTLQQQCIEQQEKQDKLNKECRKLETEMIKSKKKNDHLQSTVSSIQKQINLKKKKESRQTKNEPTQRSEQIKIEYAVLKSLKYQYSARTIEDLSDKFDDLSSDIHEGLELNLKLTGPYFNNHLLIGSVNKDWIFVYCPCTSRIVISKESYSDQPDVLHHLPDYFECKSNCRNYRTSSSSTDSDSDTEDQIVSKGQMATF